jgi:hypothetical protein
VIGLTDTGILKWILVCSGARLGIRCKINDDDDDDINLRPRGMVTRPPEGYRDVLS